MRAEIKAILPLDTMPVFLFFSQSPHYWRLCCGLNFISVSDAVAQNLAFSLDLLFCKDQYVYDSLFCKDQHMYDSLFCKDQHVYDSLFCKDQHVYDSVL